MKVKKLFNVLLPLLLVLMMLSACKTELEASEAVAGSSAESSVVDETPTAEAPVVPEVSESVPEVTPMEEEPSAIETEDPEESALDLTASSYSIRLIQGGTAEAQLDIYSGRVQDIFLYSDILGSEAEFSVDEISNETVCTVRTNGPNLTISGAKAGDCDVTASSEDEAGNSYVVTVHVAVNDEGRVSFQDLTNTGEGPGGGAPGGPGGGAPGGAPGGPPPDGAPPSGGMAPLGGVAASMEPGGIMFCGSSLMGGFNVGQYLSEDGYEVSTGSVTMGGTTIADFAAAQQEHIVDLQPGAIFINIGSVDIDRVASGVFDMQFMYDSYKELLTYLRDNLPDCKIYVMAYYPSQENTFRPNALVNQCNIWVEDLANELELNYINVSGVLKNDRGYLREDFSSDGIHMTDEAYRLVYAEMKEVILESVGLK